MVWFGMVGFGVGLVRFVLPEELLSKAGMVAALLTQPDNVGMVWFRMVGFGTGMVSLPFLDCLPKGWLRLLTDHPAILGWPR